MSITERFIAWFSGAIGLFFVGLAIQCAWMCQQKRQGMDMSCWFSRALDIPCDPIAMVFILAYALFALGICASSILVARVR